MISAALAADLDLLTDALGDPDGHLAPDIADTLRQLAAQARAAVSSYLGLSVVLTAFAPAFRFTVLDDEADAREVRASLRLPLPAFTPRPEEAGIAIILYAAKPGAFVDLAADIGFLSGRPLATIEVDQHLSTAADPDTTGGLQAAATINEAIGVLLARGRTPEQARRDLDEQAAHANTDRHAAAELLLAGLTGTGADSGNPAPDVPGPDARGPRSHPRESPTSL